MKIVYICLCGLYIPGWSYQENMLSKYHIKDGHQVTIITSDWTYDYNSKFVPYEGEKVEYDHNAKIVRLSIKGHKSFEAKLKRFSGLYEAIDNEKPDIIFLHSPQLLDADIICKYLKHNAKVRLIVDNHNDFRNAAKNMLSKYILHGVIWKHSVHLLNKYAEVFYGVTPARIDFLVDMYGLKRERIKLLPFGTDDELVEQAVLNNSRKNIREKFNIKDDDKLLLTGGKIDYNKPETLDLMEAVILMSDPHVKLMVYGSVIPELEEKFNSLIKNDRIIYIGWLKSDDIYPYQEAADLIVFPGLHSVLWEQSVGAGKACLFRKIEGFTHIDIGGNCEFFEDVSVESIKEKITNIVKEDNKINSMELIAKEKGKKEFSYRHISRECI